jgi:hypothetical protein
MEDLLDQIGSACFGLTLEDVKAQLLEIPTVPPEKVDTLAAYFVSLAEAA